jgi:hypothetical protein
VQQKTKTTSWYEAEMEELTTENMACKPELLALRAKVDMDASIVAGLRQATILRIQYTVTSSSQNDDFQEFVIAGQWKATASTRYSSGVRFRRLPALRTSCPLGPAQFRRNAVSRSNCASTGPNSRPCVSATPARVLRSSASSISPRSTRPRSRNPLSELR